ncbi:hypothetical protein ALO64_100583 [Pseudomonas meliae]|uniref:Uncharacterized protein n=1 Tax=Pseudomonas meliae TaxID=86176 RepID=A0A0P9UM28_9PSED|nr:hypothetical protein ALO64_100583 [Pseudomonas meliae]
MCANACLLITGPSHDDGSGDVDKAMRAINAQGSSLSLRSQVANFTRLSNHTPAESHHLQRC